MDALLADLRKRIGSKGLDSISAEIVLRQAYEQAYGIFDHEGSGSSRPMALVAAHPKEDYMPYGSMYRAMCDFVELEIYQKTGIDLDTYMKRPRWLNILTQETVKSKVLAEETKELNKLQQAEKDFNKYGKR